MKKKSLLLMMTVTAGLLFSACSSPSKMIDAANQVQTKCEPAVLEAKAGVIDARYTLTFPEKYFHPKAVLELIPVLIYDGGEEVGPSKWVQGESVNDNHTVIPKTGGSVSQAVQFPFKEGMQTASFVLRAKLHYKGQATPFTAPYKLADGTITTYMLAQQQGTTVMAVDAYQKTYSETREARIQYAINSSVVRPSELSKEDLKTLEAFLSSVDNDPKKEAVSTNIVAYASPEGPLKLNENLSANRGKTAKDALDKATKKVANKGAVNVSSVSEDWDGFRELVSASNVPDRDLILRVLSMYSDPIVREREIKNMSKVYQILADKVLPELRRAKIVSNVEITNYSDTELRTMANQKDFENMDVEALLYSATLINEPATKISIYDYAAKKFNDWRAYNNLANVYLSQNNIADAKAAMSKITTANDITKNNNGVIALREGRIDDAAKLFGEASAFAQARENMGAISILKGNYNDAVSQLANTNTFNEALANVLVKNYDKASNILKNLNTGNASYLNAVIAARNGNTAKVATELYDAYSKDSSLKTKALRDIEFAKFKGSI